MDDNLEQAKKKADECQTDLTFELDSYTLSRIRPSASGLSRFLATNRKAFHRKQMRMIVNDYFNKEEGDEPSMPLSRQPSFPNQTLPRTMTEYRELLKKKTEECTAALIYELETYIQSRFRSSATGRSARFYANLQSFHREQMLLIIDDYFNTEEDDLPTFPSSTTVHSVSPLDATSNREAASDLLDTTLASQSISPVIPGDQQQLANISEVQVMDEPIEEDCSTRPREVDNPSTNENMVNVSPTEQHQSDIEADSDCGCDDCMADKRRVQADSVMISPECGNSDAVANEALSTAGHVSEVTNNQEIDEDINSLLNQENNQVEEGVSLMQTDAQQQASVPTAVNSNNEQQIDNSVNNNVEINDSQNGSTEAANEQESQAMMINEEEANLEEDPNGPIIIVVQYSSPLSSPSNAEQSIHSFEDGDDDLEVEESVAQMQTDTPQQASVPTAVKSNNEQVNSNFENLNESQVMDFNDEDAVDEQSDFQSDSQSLFDEAFVDETLPTVGFVSLPSTSTGRRLTRSKKMVNYVEPEEDSLDEDSTINRNGKRTIPLAGKLSTHKRVAVEQVVVADEEGEDKEDEEDEVGVEAATHLTVIVHHLNCTEAGCTEEFKDKAQLIGHLLSKHQIMEFRCKVKDCGLSFATQDELIDHRKSAHQNLKNWPCAQCETTRKSYHELSTHFSNYHQKGRFDCSADKCDFTGKTRIQVYSHQEVKHRPAKYECTFANCTMSFKRQSHLTIHQRIHTQERPFACEECHKAFNTKGDLTVHERIHSGLKPYICKWPGCDYSARQRPPVYTHVRILHFGLPASKKKQDEQNIIDTRNAGEFIEKIPTN